MDKYGLSNETRAAEDDSSALYHIRCSAVVGQQLGGGGSLKHQCELSHSQLAFRHNGYVL